VSIDDGATGVGLVEQLRVTFSEPMDPLTMTSTSVLVEGRSVTGYVDYDGAGRTASFVPDTLFADSTPFQLVVSTDVTDAEGNAMASEHVTSFTTGPFDEAHLEDHMEPNDGPEQARVIGLNEWVRSLTVYPGTEDQDYFQFTLEETTKVHAVIAMRHCEVDQNWRTWFRRPDGEWYSGSGYSICPGETRSVYHTLAPGTHLVSVGSEEEDPWSYALFDFKLETDEPCRDDAYEDNDFREDAPVIEANQSYQLVGCWADFDFFLVDVDEGQTLTVTLTTPAAGYYRGVAILDPDGLWVSGATENQELITVGHTAEESGLHYIRIRLLNEAVQYHMDVVVE
jgi:hypothetical protein